MTEGSAVFGGLVGREHYDWSTPGLVRLICQHSNIAVPGGIWEFHVTDGPSAGSHIAVNFDRKMYGLKGRLLEVFMGLGAKQAFRSNFQKTLKILESEPAASTG